MKRPGLFLDRDGVINVPPPPEQRYLLSPDEFRLMPGIVELIRMANDAEWPVAVVTNQKCVALGLLSEEGLHLIHERMQELFAEAGVHVENIQYCPCDEYAGCDCRKPLPGMLFRAAEVLNIDTHRSWMLGDQRRDLQAGAAAGCRCIGIDAAAQAPEAELAADDLPTLLPKLSAIFV